jgi:hypothetical protein
LPHARPTTRIESGTKPNICRRQGFASVEYFASAKYLPARSISQRALCLPALLTLYLTKASGPSKSVFGMAVIYDQNRSGAPVIDRKLRETIGFYRNANQPCAKGCTGGIFSAPQKEYLC